MLPADFSTSVISLRTISSASRLFAEREVLSTELTRSQGSFRSSRDREEEGSTSSPTDAPETTGHAKPHSMQMELWAHCAIHSAVVRDALTAWSRSTTITTTEH